MIQSLLLLIALSLISLTYRWLDCIFRRIGHYVHPQIQQIANKERQYFRKSPALRGFYKNLGLVYSQSAVRRLIEHLLKRCYVPLPECYVSWQREIRAFYNDIKDILEDAPSLKTDVTWSENYPSSPNPFSRRRRGAKPKLFSCSPLLREKGLGVRALETST